MKFLGKILKKPLDLYGNVMQKTSMKFQLESALASYGFILLSLIFLFFYQIYTVFTGTEIGWSIFYAINALCGIFIIYSSMVGTYMSYLQVMTAMETQELFKEQMAQEEVKKVLNEVKG